MEIQQAMGTPKGRTAGAAYLRAFVEDVKASGFVADALKRSNQTATVAPPAANPDEASLNRARIGRSGPARIKRYGNYGR